MYIFYIFLPEPRSTAVTFPYLGVRLQTLSILPKIYVYSIIFYD